MPTYIHNGKSYQVTVEWQADGSYRAVIDDREITGRASQAADGGWLIETDGSRHTVYTASQGSERFVYANGIAYALSVPDPRQAARRRSGGSEEGVAALNAQMPGKVTAVLVTEGDQVQRGQTLVILEAMKMEIRVSASSEGVVTKLLVETGQVVERGQLLAEISAGKDK